MNPDTFPPELVELENRLRGRPDDEPTSGLRDRVLQAAAFASTAPSSGDRNSGAWAAIAAALFLAMNLSMFSASQAEFSARSVHGPDQLTTELQTLRQLEAQQEGILK